MSILTWWPRVAAAAVPCYLLGVVWLDHSAISGPYVDAVMMPGLLALAFGEPLLKRFGLAYDGWFTMPTAAGSLVLIALYAIAVWGVLRLLTLLR